MLIYDRKGNSIDIYTMNPKVEEVKRYRKSVIRRHKTEIMFYTLRTNCKDTIANFNEGGEIDIKLLNYDKDTIIEVSPWSSLESLGNLEPSEVETQQEIIERYIEGEYDSVNPVKTFDYNCKDDIFTELNRLLKTESEKIVTKNSQGNIWEIKNIINLPKSLYLLQLLQQGKYGRLISENITRQLSLFDIEYLKSVNIMDIKDMIETGLVSGTLFEAVSKANIGSKILQKRKNKRTMY